jgi:hypothetical protein
VAFEVKVRQGLMLDQEEGESAEIGCLFRLVDDWLGLMTCDAQDWYLIELLYNISQSASPLTKQQVSRGRVNFGVRTKGEGPRFVCATSLVILNCELVMAEMRIRHGNDVPFNPRCASVFLADVVAVSSKSRGKAE